MKSLFAVALFGLVACGSVSKLSPDAQAHDAAADTALPDACTAALDCAGTCGGSAALDNCAVCDTDPTNDCKWPDSTTAFCSTGSVSATCPSTPDGQDGDYQIHVPTYVVGTDTVTDPVTSLVWQRNPPYTAVTQTAAATYCNGLSLAGLSWRVPTRLELASLTDDGAVLPPLDPVAFPGVPQNSNFWTSTPYLGTPGETWSMNTNYPAWLPTANTNNSNGLVRCVSGTASFSTGSLTVVGSSVYDSRTNLYWQSDVAPSTLAWSDALAYCEGLTLDSHDDWRLPSNKELASIVDDTQTSPAISTLFTMRPTTSFWSSSPGANGANHAYLTGFSDGSTSLPVAMTGLYSVRCVRNNP